MNRKIEVGTVLKLETAVLGNDAGTLGVCYDKYYIGGTAGYAFIFPNGRYDGFSSDEVDMFFVDGYQQYANTIGDYQFENVMKLSEHFEHGRFDEVFKGWQ